MTARQPRETLPQAAEKLADEAEALGITTELQDISKALKSNKDRPLRRSLTMREELKNLGIVPSYLILEIMQKAIKAFDEERGLSDKGDAGTAYLAVAMKGAETLAKYNYASMKAVQISLDEAKKHFDASDPKQILDAVISDPFFTDEQRKELVDQLMKKKDIQTITVDKDALPIGSQNKEE